MVGPGAGFYSTNFISSTQLSLPNFAVRGVGTYLVYVVDPAPAGTSAVFMLASTQPPPPTITSISPSSAQTGSSATLMITGTNFQNGASLTFNGGSYFGIYVSSTQLELSISLGGVPAGTYPITVVNPIPTPISSSAVNFTVTGPPSFAVSGSAVTIAAGNSGSSTITVSPGGGFTGQVAVTCPAVGLPPGVTCTPNPLNITVSGAAAVTGQLMINTTGPSTTLTASLPPAVQTTGGSPTGFNFGRTGWWSLSALTGSAALLLIFLPGRKRSRAALELGLVCVLCFALGCGGGSYGGGGGGGGPQATITKLTVTNPKVASGTGFSFNVTVTGGTPGGTVQLFDGATTLGTPAALANGSVTITSPALAVGTHSISAHYSGDTATLASQSGALNTTVTGVTTVAISTTPASSNGSPAINITIQ